MAFLFLLTRTLLGVAGEEIEKFKTNYTFIKPVARNLNTSSKLLARLLMDRQIIPVTGSKIDGGCKYIFKKHDLECVDLVELIRRGRQETNEATRISRNLKYKLEIVSFGSKHRKKDRQNKMGANYT